MTVLPRVTAVVVAYGPEPLLPASVRALGTSTGVSVEVVVVDNGGATEEISLIRREPGVRVVGDGTNIGFAAGCNLGAEHGTGDYLAFVNPDAVVDPGALAGLVAVLDDHSVGIATASVRLADAPDLMNSAGNEVHFLGFSWCGGLGRPATEFSQRRDVAAASGAAMALRREAWNELGGFAPEYFAYYEDSELSLRCWQRGWRVVFTPDAIVQHRYEFDRRPTKLYLVERNRLVAMATLFETRTLVLLLPALMAAEGAMFLAAVAGGWSGDKARGWAWCWQHRRWIRDRRARLQAERRLPDSTVAHQLSTRMRIPDRPMTPMLRALDALLAAYWRAVRTFLPRPSAERHR